MQELIRFVFLAFVALFVLFSLVQCRSVFTETMDRQKNALSNVDYINLCMFRKSRLCDYIREMDNANVDQKGDDQELWKRGVSQFYSNW